MRRVVSPGRAENFKETNPQAALETAKVMEVYRLKDYPYCKLDVTTIKPEDAAEQILNELSK